MDMSLGSGWLNFPDSDWKEVARELDELQRNNGMHMYLLLKSFVEGFRYAYKAHLEDAPPQLLIDLSIPSRTRAAMYAWSKNNDSVVLSALHLECQGWLDPKEIQVIMDREDGEAYFIGTAKDRFLLNGVEEGDHTIVHRYTPHEQWEVPSGHKRRVTYDAQPVELHALGTQLHAAEHFHMADYTKTLIRERILEARSTLSPHITNALSNFLPSSASTPQN